MTDAALPRSRLPRVLWATAAVLVLLLVAAAWWSWPRTESLQPDWIGATALLAGDGTGAPRDGDARAAAFADPFGIAAGPDGTLFVADAGDSPSIRVITPGAIVFTLAGGTRGFADGIGRQARFDTPSGLALAPDGSLVVADTANNAIRRVTPEGQVTTIAGGGPAGYADGAAGDARFNGPLGVAVDVDGRIFVADTYNDRIRAIDPGGVVTTLAGGHGPGFVDGPGADARFHTPSGIAVAPGGTILVADTGNGVVRALDATGAVGTVEGLPWLARPTGIAAASVASADAPVASAFRRPNLPVASVEADPFEIYITDERGRIVAGGPGRTPRVIVGDRPGFQEGSGAEAAFRRPSGVARLGDGRLVVTDSGNGLVRLVAAASRLGLRPPASPRVAPAFDADAFRWLPLLWPVVPREGPHEIAGTLGEARGEGAERLHAGIDVRIEQGTPVHAVREGVVDSPLAAYGFGTLNEGVRVGPIAYIHVRVGRARGDRLYDHERFVPQYDERGRLAGIRVKRGARFASGDVLASVNAFNHVHLNVGWPGEEHNPLDFRLVNFVDTIPPTINAVRFHAPGGEPFSAWTGNRLAVSGPVQIVVDAWDMAEGNRPGRRLGLYALGYQVRYPDGTPVPGFERADDTIRFNRLAGDRTAAHLIFAPGSGIPFYSGGRTRFLYTVTNTLEDGIASEGFWDTAALAPGDYVVRVWGRDAAGNTTVRDVPVSVN